jgi:hypothetical protein
VITATGKYGRAVDRLSDGIAGMLNISGGVITATGYGGRAVENNFGIATISGGDFTATGNNGEAVFNNRGMITISGGKFTATGDGCAVSNWLATVNISGGEFTTTDNGEATVVNIESELTISGGTVRATKGYAVGNWANEGVAGQFTLSGSAIVFAYGIADTSVISGPYSRSEDAVIVSWDHTATVPPVYTAGTFTDIYKLPASATTVWKIEGSKVGIFAKNGTTEGFISVDGVTVNGVGIAETQLSNITVYPNPTSGVVYIEVAGQVRNDIRSVEVFDVMGRMQNGEWRTGNGGKLSLQFGEGWGEVNISHLPSGIYFLKIETEQGTVMKKVMKE